MKHNSIYEVSSKGTRLWGHNAGRNIRVEIEAMLEALPMGDTLIIDLNNVEVIDFSFASEVFGKVYATLANTTPGRAVVLVDLSEYVQENLSAAMTAMGLMALTAARDGNWTLLGKVSETDRETLAIVAQQQHTTAPEVAEALQIKLTTCNQRLRKLVEAGAIIRTRIIATSGGEQYTYTWPL